MSDEKELIEAREVYKTLCAMLDEQGWKYDKDEEKLTIDCGVRGEDLPINLVIEVDKERRLVSLLSHMPFVVPENRRTAIAVAVSLANFNMVDGNFDYNYLNGHLLFRLTSSYRESLIGKNLFAYMISCACFTVDAYNDKFYKVISEETSVEEIFELFK